MRSWEREFENNQRELKKTISELDEENIKFGIKILYKNIMDNEEYEYSENDSKELTEKEIEFMKNFCPDVYCRWLELKEKTDRGK